MAHRASNRHQDNAPLTPLISPSYQPICDKRWDTTESSSLRKYVIELATADAGAIDELVQQAEAQGGTAENWGTTTNILCAQCSRGDPHDHEGQSTPAHPHCGLAARDDAHVQSIISAWLERNPRADLVRWFEVNTQAV